MVSLSRTLHPQQFIVSLPFPHSGSSLSFLSPSKLWNPPLLFGAPCIPLFSLVVAGLFFTSFFSFTLCASLSLPKWALSCYSRQIVPEVCAQSVLLTSLLGIQHPTPSLLCATQRNLSLLLSWRSCGGTVWLCRALASLLLNHQSAACVGWSVWADTSVLRAAYSMQRGAFSGCHMLMTRSYKGLWHHPCMCAAQLNAPKIMLKK